MRIMSFWSVKQDKNIFPSLSFGFVGVGGKSLKFVSYAEFFSF